MNDKELWANFIEGDPVAFRTLYNNYVEKLYSFGLRYTHDEHLVRDCIHDLFIDLHRYRASLSKAENVGFYLIKSLKNKLVTVRKKTKSQGVHQEMDDEMPFAPFEYHIEHQLISDEQEAEKIEALQKEVAQLTNHQREILYLRFNRDLSYDEIAAIMQISVASCRSQMFRTIRRLRERLGSVISVLALTVFF